EADRQNNSLDFSPLTTAVRAPRHSTSRPRHPLLLCVSWRRVSRVVNARLELPPSRSLHVRIFVIPVVLYLVLVSAQSNHQHVHLPLCAVWRGVDDVVDVDVMNALADPTRSCTPIGSTA